MGYRPATAVAVKAGLVVAVGVFVLAIPLGNTLLMGIAAFGGYTCWMTSRQLKMTAGDPALEGYDFDRGYAGMPQDDDEDADRRLAKRRQKEQDEQRELDRILAKIASTGMGSLSKSERRWLGRATERRRRV